MPPNIVASRGEPTRAIIEWSGAVLSMLLGALIVFPVFALGRRCAGLAGGLVAAVGIALAPIHVMYSALGNVDHHGAETLLVTLYFAAWVRLVDRCEAAGVHFADLLPARAARGRP